MTQIQQHMLDRVRGVRCQRQYRCTNTNRFVLNQQEMKQHFTYMSLSLYIYIYLYIYIVQDCNERRQVVVSVR